MSDSDRRRHAVEVAHNAYHEHNEQCACRTVEHLTEWVANAVYNDVAYISFRLPPGFRWLADSQGRGEK